MNRIRIVHETQYHYIQPVKFGPHRALLRPREGHDVHISRSQQRTVGTEFDRLIVVVLRFVDDADALHDTMTPA